MIRKTLFRTKVFLKYIFTVWCNYSTRKAILSYKNKIIWNNSYIKSDEKPLYYNTWFNNGIKCIKDIYDDESKGFIHLIDLKT